MVYNMPKAFPVAGNASFWLCHDKQNIVQNINNSINAIITAWFSKSLKHLAFHNETKRGNGGRSLDV